MENLHVNQNQSRLLIVNYGYNNNLENSVDLKIFEKYYLHDNNNN